MESLLVKFPEQFRTAAKTARSLKLSIPFNPRNIIVTALGGSAIGGDLARSVIGQHLAIPLTVNRDYNLPKFVDKSSLVFACSYSGNTEETLSSYSEAKQAGAAIVCITSGGRLESMAKSDGFSVVLLPGNLPPRAALGYSTLALLGAVQALGLTPDLTDSMNETGELLDKLLKRYGPDSPESANPAKRLADSLCGKIVAVYGSSAILEAAAYRWRSQIAENSKNLALNHVLPEMNHNELVGWMHPADVLRSVGVVLLRDKGDHPQVQRRFELTKQLIDGKAGTLHEAWSEGNSLLARVMSIIYLGDFVSLYLALLNNTDPSPVQVINYLKQKLSEPASR